MKNFVYNVNLYYVNPVERLDTSRGVCSFLKYLLLWLKFGIDFKHLRQQVYKFYVWYKRTECVIKNTEIT